MKDLPEHGPVSRLTRILLVLAGLDILVYGSWAVFLPGQVFRLLDVPSPHDVVLWRVVGLLLLAHLPCLVQAALDPGWRGILLAPALARLLLGIVWLWLLLAGHVGASRRVLLALLAHDLAGGVLLLGLMQPFPARRSA